MSAGRFLFRYERFYELTCLLPPPPGFAYTFKQVFYSLSYTYRNICVIRRRVLLVLATCKKAKKAKHLHLPKNAVADIELEVYYMREKGGVGM